MASIKGERAWLCNLCKKVKNKLFQLNLNLARKHTIGQLIGIHNVQKVLFSFMNKRMRNALYAKGYKQV